MRFYVMKYRLPMSHSSSGHAENGHHHVLEVTVQARTAEEEGIAEAGDMERVLRQCLDGYRNQYLNGMEEFGGDASIENITEVFYRRIVEAYSSNGWTLTKVEVGENPLRVCVIENRSA